MPAVEDVYEESWSVEGDMTWLAWVECSGHRRLILKARAKRVAMDRAAEEIGCQNYDLFPFCAITPISRNQQLVFIAKLTLPSWW